MSVSSMTGFAREGGVTVFNDKKQCSWFFELKSVNGKSLDVKTKLPSFLEGLSMFIKNEAVSYFARGSISAYLEVDFNKSGEIAFNEELLKQLVSKAIAIYDENNEKLSRPSISEMFAVKGVVEVADNVLSEDETAQLINDLQKGFKNACDALLLARQAEGEKICLALKEILNKISIDVAKIEQKADVLPEKLKEKLSAQIKELLSSDIQVSEDRLAQEVCLYVARADIREEIDRLKAHIQTALNLLDSGEPVGRRLDFLCQELNREANTTCSKSCDIEITNLGMELKTLIEQFREQVQNME